MTGSLSNMTHTVSSILHNRLNIQNVETATTTNMSNTSKMLKSYWDYKNKTQMAYLLYTA